MISGVTMKSNGLLVGLTGQTGAGKTTVSGYLSRLGYRVIDADMVARHVVAKGGECIAELALSFGDEILLPDQTLDRRKMGDIIFADKEKRALLGKIIFPYIQREILSEVKRMRADGAPIIFLDAPTLFESGIYQKCDKIISVIAPENIRLARIMARDKLSKERALSRMRSQHGDEFYTRRSDYVISNGGDLSELREQLDSVIDKIELANLEGSQ